MGRRDARVVTFKEHLRPILPARKPRDTCAYDSPRSGSQATQSVPAGIARGGAAWAARDPLGSGARIPRLNTPKVKQSNAEFPTLGSARRTVGAFSSSAKFDACRCEGPKLAEPALWV